MFWENITQGYILHHLLVTLFYQAKDILKESITKFCSMEMYFCFY